MQKSAPSGLGRTPFDDQGKEARPYTCPEARQCAARLVRSVASVALLPLCGLILFGGAGCKQQKQPSPDVWATVNGQDIKHDEVDKFYRTRVSPEGRSLRRKRRCR